MAETAKATENTGAVTTAPETATTGTTQEPAKKETAKKETPKKAPEAKETAKATEGKKVYQFTSENKYLTVGAVGVQFVAGKAHTDNVEVAKVLATIEGVVLVEG